jgi:hypothetical protein
VKLLSNVLFLMALAALLVAIVTGARGLYYVAGVAFVASFLTTAIKRRRYRAKKARPTGPR